MKITLRQVEIFVTVAEHLHFGRAAEALHISQPTVSQEVGRLERALGLSLFDRTRRSVSLTSAGEAMAEEGRKLLSQAEGLVSRVRLYEESRMKTIRVVATPSVVNRLLPAVISRAEKELPELVIEDIAVETGAVSSRLATGHGDIGLGRFLDPVDGLRTEVIADEEVFVALSRNHPSADAARTSLEELDDLPLLLWPREQNPKYYDYVRTVCVERGLNPMVLVSPPRIVGSRLYLLSEARAFSLVPGSTVGHLSDDLRAVPLEKPATLPLEMQWRADDPRPYVRALCELIVDEAGNLERTRSATTGPDRGPAS
ncbi:LysR family transcriptional regulator [Streptomyces nodosus]|uniref:LysR family transcriptional regulator n=1 Tax=Streptomyces nodosus TaxID=40318 RepID=UPI0034529B91